VDPPLKTETPAAQDASEDTAAAAAPAPATTAPAPPPAN
jgi:hypothetical protein